MRHVELRLSFVVFREIDRQRVPLQKIQHAYQRFGHPVLRLRFQSAQTVRSKYRWLNDLPLVRHDELCIHDDARDSPPVDAIELEIGRLFLPREADEG